MADDDRRALLVVLETLAPAERLAFVLHDMFALPFDEIAAMRLLGHPAPPPRLQNARSIRDATLGTRSAPDPRVIMVVGVASLINVAADPQPARRPSENPATTLAVARGVTGGRRAR